MIEPEKSVESVGVVESLLSNTKVEEQSIEANQEFVIAGFWRRVFAFLIDLTILALPFFIIGLLFSSITFRIGPWGRLFSYSVVFIYWGTMSTSASKGQTLGKKVLKTAVVDQNGQYLPASRTYLRALVLVLISIINGWAIPVFEWTIVALIATTITIGGGLAMMYGLVFNRTTRQGVHDIIAHSYVIKIPPNPHSNAPFLPKVHKYIMIFLMLSGLFIGIFTTIWTPNFEIGPYSSSDLDEITQLKKTISDDEFFLVELKKSIQYINNNPTPIVVLEVEAWAKESCKENMDICEKQLIQLAQEIMDNYQDIDEYTGMDIKVYSRFDFGFVNGTVQYQFKASIDNWRSSLEKLNSEE